MSYESCCEPLHRGLQRAATAEQLMRSRYSAFVFAEVDYLIATHPDSLTPLLQRRKELRKNCREAHWLGLKIKAVEAGGVDDLEGTVTFEATFGASMVGAVADAGCEAFASECAAKAARSTP